MNRFVLALILPLVGAGCTSMYNLPDNPTSWQSCIPQVDYMDEIATEEALVCLDVFYRTSLAQAGKEPIRLPSKKPCEEYRVLGDQAFPYCSFGQRMAYNRTAYPSVRQLHTNMSAQAKARQVATKNDAIDAEVRRWMALTPEQKEAEIYRKQLVAAQEAEKEHERQMHLCRARAYSAPTATGHFAESLEHVAKCTNDPNYDPVQEAKARCGYKTVTGQYNMVDHGRLGTWTERLYVCD